MNAVITLGVALKKYQTSHLHQTWWQSVTVTQQHVIISRQKGSDKCIITSQNLGQTNVQNYVLSISHFHKQQEDSVIMSASKSAKTLDLCDNVVNGGLKTSRCLLCDIIGYLIKGVAN